MNLIKTLLLKTMSDSKSYASVVESKDMSKESKDKSNDEAEDWGSNVVDNNDEDNNEEEINVIKIPIGFHKFKVKKIKNKIIYHNDEYNIDINLSNGAVGWFQNRPLPKDYIVEAYIMYNSDDEPIITHIKACPAITFYGKITYINKENNFGFVRVNRYNIKKEEEVSIYIPDIVMDFNNEENVFNSLEKNKYCKFKIEDTHDETYKDNPGKSYKISNIEILEWNEGEICDINKGEGFGKIKPIDKSQSEKTISKYQIYNFMNFKLLEKVEFLSDPVNDKIILLKKKIPN